MSTENLSLDLYKSNVELQLRLTRLMQESGHQWLEAVQRTSTENIAETTNEIESLMRTGNWQSLLTLPSESFWRLFQQRAGDVQLLNQIALKNQAAFTSGLQQALENWQKSVSSVVAGSANATPALQDIFKQWGATWAEVVQPKQAKSAKGG